MLSAGLRSSLPEGGCLRQIGERYRGPWPWFASHFAIEASVITGNRQTACLLEDVGVSLSGSTFKEEAS